MKTLELSKNYKKLYKLAVTVVTIFGVVEFAPNISFIKELILFVVIIGGSDLLLILLEKQKVLKFI